MTRPTPDHPPTDTRKRVDAPPERVPFHRRDDLYRMRIAWTLANERAKAVRK